MIINKTRKNYRFFVSRKLVKFSRKSQVALEFLTTYAWAFLGIMVTLGALYYFGVFNFSKYLPQECIFPSQFECVAFSFVGATDEVRFRLVNNIGEQINIKSISITNELPLPLSCSLASPPTLPFSWQSGTEVDITFNSCTGGGFIDKERTEAEISITYCAPATVGCITGSSVDHTVNGKIKAAVS